MPATPGSNPHASRLSSSRLESVRKDSLAQPKAKQHSSSAGSRSTSLLGRPGVLPPTNQSTNSPLSNDGHDDYQEDDEDGFIEPLFQTALHIVQSSLPKSGQIQPTYNDKLLLYSLFKQAVHGDVKSSTVSKRPGVFDMLGRAKWDAWKAKEGLSCSEAKRLYIESVLKLLRSHRDRPEARLLIESLSGYEAYSAGADHLSDSDEDLYSEQKIEIPTSIPGSLRTASGKERAQGGADEERSESTSISDEKSAEEEDVIQTSGLGPYKSSSQLPDPINSSETHILPPHSPRAIGTASGSSSGPRSQSPSAKNDSSPPQASLVSVGSDPIERSEPRFTYAQVQRLVDQTPQSLPFTSHTLRSPLKNHPHSHTDSVRLHPPHSSDDQYFSSHALLQSNLHKLNQAIDSLQILISKIEQHHFQPSSDPSPQNRSNSSPSPPSPHPPHKLNSLLSLSRLRTLVRNIWLRRFFFDLSLFFVLIKALKFFNKRPSQLISS
ncbi:hypothetical protein PtB15_15B51 [Puccinia triticina]|nr:hypothetical protein PtB15_15B51 [Puccinia triticina]